SDPRDSVPAHSLQHALAAGSWEYDRRTAKLAAFIAPGFDHRSLLKPRTVLYRYERTGFWRNVWRGLRLARLHLDSRQIRSRLGPLFTSDNRVDDGHLVYRVLHSIYP